MFQKYVDNLMRERLEMRVGSTRELKKTFKI